MLHLVVIMVLNRSTVLFCVLNITTIHYKLLPLLRLNVSMKLVEPNTEDVTVWNNEVVCVNRGVFEL